MTDLFAAYQRAKTKSATGEFNFARLTELIDEIEREEFSNRAGYLNNFDSWLKIKEILGLAAERR